MKSSAPKEYLCLVHFEGSKLTSMTKSEKNQLDRDSLAYDEMIKKSGHLIIAEALQSPDKARIVSVREGKTSVVDGPFTETKEQLGGFILIKATTMREAERIATGIPLAKLGRIEVRPIYTIPGSN
jgi:hypothetical protein